MKRRSWLWIVTSVILAVLAGVVAIWFMRTQFQSQVIPRPDGTPTARRAVVVAANAIAKRSEIGPDNVRVEERNEADIPSGAAKNTQDVIGKTALRDFPTGDVLVMQYVTNVISPTLELKEDKVAVALPADDILSKWGAVVPGDHVDVLVSLDVVLETPMRPEEMPTTEQGLALLAMERDQSLDKITMLSIQDLEILQILEEPRPEGVAADQEEGAPAELPRKALVLAINPQDAVVLKYLMNSNAKIDVALRAPDNPALFDIQPVNVNYLVLRYGIVVPQSP
jgi:Flp pilus assembly protein CpaB